MKKLMSLGGNYYQMSLVKTARRMGIYTISVDYLPSNPAHKYANEYYNISIIDKDAILKLAKEKQIDGIISFASDIGTLTAAYVAEKLHLPTNPYHTMELMINKNLFHPFLHSHGFNVPDVITVYSTGDAEFFLAKYKKILIKPLICSGSKGITIVDNPSILSNAIEIAQSYSIDGLAVAEQYIEKNGRQISGDIFIANNNVVMWGLANAHRDLFVNPLVPVGNSFPLVMDDIKISVVKSEISRAIALLGYKNGPINVEVMFDSNDNPVIVELGPRSGGGLISDTIYMCTGIDILSYCVRCAIGDDISDLRDSTCKRYIGTYEFHSRYSGIFNSINIDNSITDRMLLCDIFVSPGAEVVRYQNASHILGIALLEFESPKEMIDMMDNMNQYIDIELSKNDK